MYSVGPDDVPVEQTRERIADLERQSRRLSASTHPLARLDRAYALRAIHALSADLARMKVAA